MRNVPTSDFERGGAGVHVEWVVAWVARFSYPAVFALLLACGLGAPLSEDVIVLVGGVAVAHSHGSLLGMMATAYLGKLVGDALIYRIGRQLGPRAFALPRFRKLFTPERKRRIESHFARYGVLTVFLARFLPGLRAPTYLMAGVSRFSAKKFLLADGVAAGVSAPLLTWLGYRYGLGILGRLHHGMNELVLGVVGLGVAVWVGRAVWRRAHRPAPRPDAA